MIKKLGVQLYTIRDTMNNAENIRASFKKLKELGYDQAQTAGCAIPYTEFGKIAAEEGIEIIGTHDDFGKMVNDFEGALADHQALGCKIMGVGGAGGHSTAAEWMEYVGQVNDLAKKLAPLGMTYTYHNHSHEFIKLDNGQTVMELLMENLIPGANFCLDTYWVQHGGGDVRHLIEKLTGRLDVLHLKDMGRNDNGQFITEIGNGGLWWEGIIDAAEKAGVKYYVVEQDTRPGDPFESLKISSEYIHKNFM